MRELVPIAAAGVLGIVAVSSTASHAAGLEGNMAAAIEAETSPPLLDVAQHRHHRRSAPRPSRQYTERSPYGCYRLGETGYHWYDFCVGPSWLYPHQRVCRHGYCWYQ